MVSSEQLKEFFFKAMLSGWATSSGERRKIKELPGFKSVAFTEGNLELVDSWLTKPGVDHSYGFTMIFEGRVPVWIMYYGGTYPEQAIHIVKAALTQAYSKKSFFAGRGLPSFKLDGFEYQNQASQIGFDEFNGLEIVLDSTTKKELGWHRFFGRLLR